MDSLTQIKLIVTDLDGTLLNDEKEIDSGILPLLPILKEKGIDMTFGSGRNMHIMQDYVAQLDIQIPYITNNGANLYKGCDCIYECAIIPDDLQYACTILMQSNIPFLAYSNKAVYPFGTHPSLTMFMERLRGKSDIVYANTIQDLVRESIFKVVIIDEDEQKMQKIMNTINATCKEAHCVRSEGDIYTLTNQQATKGEALKRLLEHLQRSKEEVLVFGDNYNDLSMFEVAGTSVAMKNANKELKAHATFVTKSNEAQGVSWFIQKYVLSQYTENK